MTARPTAYGLIFLLGACSAAEEPASRTTAAAGIGDCTMDPAFVACDRFRKIPPLPNPFVIPDSFLGDRPDSMSWDPDLFHNIPTYPVSICIDSKGLVVIGQVMPNYPADKARYFTPFERDAVIQARKRYKLAISTMMNLPGPGERIFSPSTHIKAVTALSNANLRSTFFTDTDLDKIRPTFVVPGSPGRQEVSQERTFVMVGNAKTEGWIRTYAWFIISPDESVDFDFSTSVDGNITGDRSRIIRDDAFESGLTTAAVP